MIKIEQSVEIRKKFLIFEFDSERNSSLLAFCISQEFQTPHFFNNVAFYDSTVTFNLRIYFPAY